MKVQLVLTLVVAMYEILSYAGVTVGWAMLHPVLVAEGYFRTGCNNTNNSTSLCTTQTEQLNLVYTISTACAPIVSLFTGWMYDAKGGWFTRTIMLCIIATGNILNVVSNPATSSWLLFISFPLINIGGYGLGIVTLGVPNLYPNMKSLVVSLISGSFDSAVVVYLLMSKLYDIGVSFNAIFIFYTCICVFYHANTFTLTPRYAPPNVLPPNYVYGYNELSCFREGTSGGGQHVTGPSDSNDSKDVEIQPLKVYLKKVYTWTNVAHFCVFHFSLTFFIGSFNNWIEFKIGSVDNSSDLIRHFTTMFGITQCLALVISPISGSVNDFFRRRFIKQKFTSKTANMKAVAMSLLIGDSLIILLFIFTLVPSKELQYVTMMLQVIGRSFMYSTSAAFISVGYPSRHLGVLYSSMECIAGFILLLQFPTTLLVTRVFDNNFDYVYAFLLCLCILALFHPFYLLNYVRQSVKPVKKEPISYDNPMFTSAL